MATPEEVSGSHALTTSEQLFCTLTAWHERVSVYVKGGVANVVGAQWRVYAINGSQKTLLFQGSSKTLLNEVVIAGIPGQGDTIALYGFNPYGVTASVKAYMVGWDPTAAVTPVQASSVAGVTLTLAEQDLSDLPGGYVNLDVAFNANGDPLARQAQIRLYALLGGVDRFQLEQFQVPDLLPVSVGSVNLLQNYMAGASEFITTVQGRLGNSAVTVTGTLEGETGSAGAGGGGGPPVGSYWPTQTQLGAGVTAPELSQATAASDVATQSILVQAQDAFVGSTGSNRNGGDISIRSGANAIGGSPGAIHFQVGSSSDSLVIDAQGNTKTSQSIQAPEFIVPTSQGGTLFPVIQSGTNVPSTVDDNGSLYLRSDSIYAGVYTKQSGGGGYLALAQLDINGTLTFDPATTVPGIRQPQSAVGAGVDMVLQTQAAKTGSGDKGGFMRLRIGADDPPTINPSSPSYWVLDVATDLSGSVTSPFIFKWLNGEVANLALGGGTNGVGADVAGSEISSFTPLSIATENASQIELVVANTTSGGNARIGLNLTHTDSTNEVAAKFSFLPEHPTGGDISGIQIERITGGSIGTGKLRYLDISDSGSRVGAIEVNPGLPGISLVGYSYLAIIASSLIQIESGAAQFSCGDIDLANSGVFGWRLTLSTADISFSAFAGCTSVLFNQTDNGAPSAVGAPTTLAAQNATGTTSTGGDLILSPGTGTSVNGKLKIANVPTSGSASAGAIAIPLAAAFLPITVGSTDYKIPLVLP